MKERRNAVTKGDRVWLVVFLLFWQIIYLAEEKGFLENIWEGDGVLGLPAVGVVWLIMTTFAIVVDYRIDGKGKKFILGLTIVVWFVVFVIKYLGIDPTSFLKAYLIQFSSFCLAFRWLNQYLIAPLSFALAVIYFTTFNLTDGVLMLVAGAGLGMIYWFLLKYQKTKSQVIGALIAVTLHALLVF